MAVYDPFDFSTALTSQQGQVGGPAQQPGLGAVMQPSPMIPQPGPPKDPADLAQRVSGWDAFLKGISTPEASQALLNAGATMLAPREGGASQMGQIAKGLAVGGETFARKGQEKAEGVRREKLLGLEERGVAQRDQQIAQSAEGLELDKKKGTEFSAQSAKTLELLTHQIAAAAAEGTPAALKRKADLELAETALKNAQAANQQAEADRGGSGTVAAGVQETDALAQRMFQSGTYGSEAEAWIAASERLNPGKARKAPEELKISALGSLEARAKARFPGAETFMDRDGSIALAKAKWVQEQEIAIDDLISSYSTRTGQGPQPSPGDAGGAPKTPPTPQDIQTYQKLKTTTGVDLVELAAQWKAHFGEGHPPPA